MKLCRSKRHYYSEEKNNCPECQSIKQKENYTSDPEKFRLRNKVGYKKHAEKRRLYSKNYRKENPEKVKKLYTLWRNKNPDYRLKKVYKISMKEYEEQFKYQSGKCAICLLPETAKTQKGKIKPLSVDHCHKTNQFRGLLCSRCNNALGLIKENPRAALGMYNYIVLTSDTELIDAKQITF